MLQVRGRQHVDEQQTHSGNVRAAKSRRSATIQQRKHQKKPGIIRPGLSRTNNHQ
jgi:hypothetical protein